MLGRTDGDLVSRPPTMDSSFLDISKSDLLVRESYSQGDRDMHIMGATSLERPCGEIGWITKGRVNVKQVVRPPQRADDGRYLRRDDAVIRSPLVRIVAAGSGSLYAFQEIGGQGGKLDVRE